MIKKFDRINRPDGLIFARQMLAEVYLGLGHLEQAEKEVIQVLDTEEAWIMPDVLRTYGEFYSNVVSLRM